MQYINNYIPVTRVSVSIFQFLSLYHAIGIECKKKTEYINSHKYLAVCKAAVAS